MRYNGVKSLSGCRIEFQLPAACVPSFASVVQELTIVNPLNFATSFDLILPLIQPSSDFGWVFVGFLFCFSETHDSVCSIQSEIEKFFFFWSALSVMDNADIMQMSHSVFPGNQCWLHSLFRLEFPRIGLGRCMQMRRLPEVKRPIRHKTLDNPDMIGWVGFFNQQRRRGPRPATTHTPTRTESKKKNESTGFKLSLKLGVGVGTKC